MSPTDRDARITKMRDGRTHLAHKAEHAMDLDTSALVAVSLRKMTGRHHGGENWPRVASRTATTPEACGAPNCASTPTSSRDS